VLATEKHRLEDTHRWNSYIEMDTLMK